MVKIDRKDPPDKPLPHQSLWFMRSALLALLGIGLILGLLWMQPGMSTAAAKGTVQIDGQWTNLEVVISRASSDDPPNRQDPGQEFDLADCLFNLVQDKTVDVAIINGYPGYSCTIYVTVHNRSGQAVQLQETVFGASPGLEVLEVNNPRPALILPGKKSDRAFQIRILERAAEQAELDFQVLFSYSPADPGP